MQVNGATPVYIAAEEGQDRALEMLLQAKADVHIAKVVSAGWVGRSVARSVSRPVGGVNNLILLYAGATTTHCCIFLLFISGWAGDSV